MRLTATGQLLTASQEDRTLRYRLLPFNEEGRTSLGKVTASRGSVEIPADPAQVTLNIEHDAKRPVGRAATVEESDEGLDATFRIARTRAGDDLLEEAAEGLRAAVSVELENVVIRAGRLVASLLTGAGAVVAPAFPSAQLVAADAGDLPEPAADDEGTSPVPDAGGDTSPETPVEETTEESDEQEEEEMSETPALASATGILSASAPKGQTNLAQLCAMLPAAKSNRSLMAALSDIVPGDILGVEQPQYIGELWNGAPFQRKVVPMFNHGTLTSYKVKGWRWVTKPVVAAYAGDKTAVPSGTVATESVEIDASRIAGAHDIDRKFRDFNDAEFFAAYFAAMTESYKKVSDAAVLTELVTDATDVEVLAADIPADIPKGLVFVVDGALSILNETDTMPTVAYVATDLWRAIILSPKDQALEYLSAAIGVESGSLSGFKIIPSAALTDTQVLVGTRSAVTVHELGGEAPIRVEAVDIANGGIDEGVFGYYAVNIHDAGGLALVRDDDGIA